MFSRAEGFGMEVKRRIMLGTYALSAGYYDAYYKKAQQVRTLIVQDFKNVLKNHDLILTPVAPTPAFKIGEKTEDPLEMYLSDIFTISLNLTGLPGLSVPCGISAEVFLSVCSLWEIILKRQKSTRPLGHLSNQAPGIK